MAESECALLERAKQLFQTADTDSSGSLSRDELYKLAQDCGFKMEFSEFTEWFSSLDKDADAKITLDEFIGVLSGRDPKDISEAEMRSAFKELDADGSGKLSVDDLKATLKSRNISDEDMEAMIKETDLDDDGKVSFEEFLKIVKTRC